MTTDLPTTGRTTGTGTLAFLATSDAEALIARCPGVARLIPEMAAALERQTATAPGLLFDLAPLSDDERLLLNEILGEGEVGATVALPDGVVAEIAESVFAGLWRVRFLGPNNAIIADYAEVSAVPQAVRRAAAMTLPRLDLGDLPAGVMNAPAVLVEIADRAERYRPGEPNHIISLTLMPMLAEDIELLVDRLGTGPVKIVSRGYGSCRVQAAAVHNVWSVQFFNAMDAILLDTIEVGDVPAAAQAAVEDFHDSAIRLREIGEAYFQ
ncbi:hydrogenase expression/formation protein [Pleomorphomonas diazotrophica]|uniref:Hydrogenase expression/formation protein n=1 Tax=Pleomorphomonas diazotrophica TaxID=1166257 RepID=A0A1I4QAY1_9HYPH|nr:hydrogenase expression/formation protein [Pleomorphomonas diazotrophica]PKR90824.1 hydrogenase expression/formation protein [Pleomorphomonas diazotrophica]SFM36956.1 hydrogenase-1 operon protein HyaF [Pleomorphomonas diazotrophica]